MGKTKITQDIINNFNYKNSIEEIINNTIENFDKLKNHLNENNEIDDEIINSYMNKIINKCRRDLYKTNNIKKKIHEINNELNINLDIDI